jgi:hypothetical protein
MRTNLLSLMAICLVLVLVTACRSGALYRVIDEPISTTSGTEPSLEQVTRAILAARTDSKPDWNMKIQEPGHIQAELEIRAHRAVVDITYTTKSYSITYNSSSNLNYHADDTGGTIHKNYNGWVQKLRDAISRRLAML